MFKPRQRQQRNQPQNPISDMEQFYLNQYFQTQGINHVGGPTVPPEAYQNNQIFPPENPYLQQLEQRIIRIEQYLGLPTQSSFNSIER